ARGMFRRTLEKEEGHVGTELPASFVVHPEKIGASQQARRLGKTLRWGGVHGLEIRLADGPGSLFSETGLHAHALAPFGAAAREHFAAAGRLHAAAEAVLLRAATAVGLERALRHRRTTLL